MRVSAYDFFNNLATVILFLFNFLNYKNKLNVLGQGSTALIKKLPEAVGLKTKISKFIIVGIEIYIISYFQYKIIGSLNYIMSELIGTGANYFGELLFSPVLVSIICFLLGINIFRQMDLITPAYPLALTISKIACFFAGCCRGFECSFGMYNYKTEAIEFPSQLLEAGVAFTIFVFLMLYRKKAKEGTMFPTYLIVYSTARFFTEFTRIEENVFLGLKKYHLLCLAGIVVGFIQLYVIKNYKEKINQLCEDFSEALGHTLNEIAIKAGFKKQNDIVHRKSRSKKKKAKTPSVSYAKKTKIANTKRWIIVWTIGLIGQIGWTVEGTWLNTFVYEKVDKTPSIITPMLIVSALGTTISIFLFGTLTDRTGKRRNLVSTGFVIWGILTVIMGFTQYIPKFSIPAAVACIVIVDFILSFFGSMSTDVGYSTWLTDIMNDSNRGQIGAAIAIQVVLGSLLGNIFGGLLIGNENNYLKLFIVMGTLLSVFGMISVFLFEKKDDAPPSRKESFSRQLAEAFSPKSFLKHKELIWVNISVMVFFVGFNIYFPHLGNYLIQYLGYSANQMGVIEGIPMILAMFATMPATKFINKNKFIELTLFSVVIGLIGNLSIQKITPDNIDTEKALDIRLLISIFLVAVSYIIMLQATKTWTKNLHPSDSKGRYEGWWAVSYAFIPMLLSSNISEWIIKNKGEAILNEATERFEYLPNGNVFLIGAIISCFSIIPIIITKKHMDKKAKNSDNRKTSDIR